jgi:hypothetical protein
MIMSFIIYYLDGNPALPVARSTDEQQDAQGDAGAAARTRRLRDGAESALFHDGEEAQRWTAWSLRAPLPFGD